MSLTLTSPWRTPSDVAGIGPVAPDGWTLTNTKPGDGIMAYVFKPQAGQGAVGKQGLAFVFHNVVTNAQTGTCQIIVKEGSAGNPTAQLFVTKFPNGWGAVSFWADPTEVSYQGRTTLHWSGPEATCTIQYVLDDQVVNVPGEGEPALGPQGQYPAQTDPPLALDQTTVFTLRVEETISKQSYQAEQQQTVTVLIPAAQIIYFKVSPIGFSGPDTPVTLSWQTANVSEVSFDNNVFTGAEAGIESTLDNLAAYLKG